MLRQRGEAVLVLVLQCLCVLSVNRRWEGLIFLRVKGLEGCVCLCYQSPAAKSYYQGLGVKPTITIKGLSGESPQIIGLIATTHK